MDAIYPLITREQECVMANHDQAKGLAKQLDLAHKYEQGAFTALAAVWNDNPASRRLVEGFLEEHYPAEWRKETPARDWTDPIRLEDADKLPRDRRRP